LDSAVLASRALTAGEKDVILGSTTSIQMLAANERARKEGTQQPSGIMQSLSILYVPPIPTTAAAGIVASAAAAAQATSIAENFPMEVGANVEVPLVQRKRQLTRAQILKGFFLHCPNRR
jgi:hypothetical protein